MSAARTGALLAAAVLCHAYGPAVQLCSAVVVGAAMGYSGYRKGSLSASGGVFLMITHDIPLFPALPPSGSGTSGLAPVVLHLRMV